MAQKKACFLVNSGFQKGVGYVRSTKEGSKVHDGPITAMTMNGIPRANQRFPTLSYFADMRPPISQGGTLFVESFNEPEGSQSPCLYPIFQFCNQTTYRGRRDTRRPLTIVRGPCSSGCVLPLRATPSPLSPPIDKKVSSFHDGTA